jgi:hypothetical protein
MNKKDEQQIPDLEGMDEQQARQFLVELYTVLSAEKEYALRHEDYVMEMPQSCERIRGRENMRAFQRAFAGYSTPPSIRIRRVLARDGLWVTEGVNDYGGQIFHGVVIFELREGKIWRDTRYYAEPFEAPEWRAQWVERMEPEEPDATPARGERRNETNEHEVQPLVDRQFAKMRAGDLAGAHEWYDAAVVLEWPQSGERVRAKENLMALRKAYPADVEFEVRRTIARRNLGVVELVIRYDGRPVNAIGIFEFRNGKVVRETHYFAEPFPPPEWRAQWVERMEA